MPGKYCAVALCNNIFMKAGIGDKDKPKVSFHRFPVNKDIRKQWITLCKRSDKFNPNAASICSEHFKPEDFIRDLQAELLAYNPTKRLCPGAIPTRNIPNDPKRPSDSAVRRLTRIEGKKERMDHLNCLKGALLPAKRPSTSPQLPPKIDQHDEIEEPSCSVSEVITPDYKLLYEEMKSKNLFLKDKVKNQTAKLKRARVLAKRLISHSQAQINNLTEKIKQFQNSKSMLKQHLALEKKKKKSQ